MLLKVSILVCSFLLLVQAKDLTLPKSLPTEPIKASGPNERLVLVSVLNRHGDRGPFEPFPKGDRHGEKPKFFWPNGLGNLSDVGDWRMFRMGKTLREYYRNFLDYDPNSFMLLSSNSIRARLSQLATLRGMLEVTRSPDEGAAAAEAWFKAGKKNSLVPKGPGTSHIWKDIPQNIELVRALDENWHESTKYHHNHPTPLKKDLALDPEIAKLTGLQKLKDMLKNNYGMNLTTDIFDPWTAIECELYIDRTDETIGYTDHYAKWINEPIVQTSDKKHAVTMYDLWEEVTLLGMLGRSDANKHYMIASPILNSILESQEVALGNNGATKVDPKRAAQYAKKKMIMYSSHDGIVTTVLHDIGILTKDGATFANRMLDAKKNGATDLEKYLQGLKMCHFGVSVKFELWALRGNQGGKEFPVIRMSLYNEADPSTPIQYVPVPIGEACRRKYMEQNPKGNLASFYSNDFKIDQQMDCPRELFKQMTAPYAFNEEKLKKIVDDKL